MQKQPKPGVKSTIFARYFEWMEKMSSQIWKMRN